MMPQGPPSRTVGARLREARQTRGVSLRQIAHNTRISVMSLEALERSDLSRLPATSANVPAATPPAPAAVAHSPTPATPSPAPATPPSSSGLTMEIAPTADCWVSATSDGEQTFSALMHAGDRRQISAREEI